MYEVSKLNHPLETHFQTTHRARSSQDQTPKMSALQATTNHSTSLSPSHKISQRRSATSSTMKSMLHTPPDALHSSGLDFLLEMNLRRENKNDKTAPRMTRDERTLPSSGLDFLLQIHRRREKTEATAQKMTRKERAMILEGARMERTRIVEEALRILDADL
jgi:hypothetical protein